MIPKDFCEKKKERRPIHPFMRSLFITGNELYVRPTDSDDHSSVANESQGEGGQAVVGCCFFFFCHIPALLAVGRNQSHLSNHCQGACINENVDGCIVAGTKKNSPAQCLQ